MHGELFWTLIIATSESFNVIKPVPPLLDADQPFPDLGSGEFSYTNRLNRLATELLATARKQKAHSLFHLKNYVNPNTFTYGLHFFGHLLYVKKDIFLHREILFLTFCATKEKKSFSDILFCGEIKYIAERVAYSWLIIKYSLYKHCTLIKFVYCKT